MKEDRAKAVVYIHGFEMGREHQRNHLIELVAGYLKMFPDAKLDEFRWLVAGDKASSNTEHKEA